MRVIIGGDIVPTRKNEELFCNGDAERLIGKLLLDRMETADFIIHNLEVPLIDKLTPIKKCGPCLSAPTETINGIKAINPYFYTLANNHILDQGYEGLDSTITILKQMSIEFAGAGYNAEDAAKVYYKEINGVILGVYCCCEHEFSIATKDKAGANLFDPLYSLDIINEASERCDYLIILYHGGKEHYRYPSPYLQKVCRKMIEKGANLVVCQHSHCIGCVEEINGNTIIYGQGNFLFDLPSDECWNTGLLIQVDIEKGKSNISYIPIKKTNETVIEALDTDSAIIMSGLLERSKKIKDTDFIYNEYSKFAKKMQWEYYSALSGKKANNMLYRLLNKLSGYRLTKLYIGRSYSIDEKIKLLNYVECEAHRELLIEVLK